MTTYAAITAQELRDNGKLIKKWKQPDGSWYEDHFEIWKLEGRFYQIQDHQSITFGGNCNFYGKVTEVEYDKPVPTHAGIILGMNKGMVWIEAQTQGTLDELTEWYDMMRGRLENDFYKRHYSYSLKIMPLDF